MTKKVLAYCFFFVPSLVLAQKDDLKVNISSLAIRNYHITYERSLTPKLSLSLGFRYMPKGQLPFEKQFKKLIKNDNVDVANTQLGNLAVTPEFRAYMGKGTMHGFYISIYGRYARFDATVPVQFTNQEGGTNQALFDGRIKSYSGGIMFGTQYTLWKIVVLDIMIVGGHFGHCNGNLLANNINPPMTPLEQQSLQHNINKNNGKTFNVSGQVTSPTSANITVSGPWAGIRSGVNVGIRF